MLIINNHVLTIMIRQSGFIQQKSTHSLHPASEEYSSKLDGIPIRRSLSISHHACFLNYQMASNHEMYLYSSTIYIQEARTLKTEKNSQTIVLVYLNVSYIKIQVLLFSVAHFITSFSFIWLASMFKLVDGSRYHWIAFSAAAQPMGWAV